jgi:hypothetical protein
MNRARLKRLEQSFVGAGDGKCRCGCCRWIICCDTHPDEKPPSACWACGGADPAGVIIEVETVDEHGNVIPDYQGKSNVPL